MSASRGTLRVAVVDRDTAFLKVLGKRLDAAGWEHRVLPSGAPVDELVAMKLNAVVVDLNVLGHDEGWDFLERVSGMLPGLGIIVCTSNSTVAQRVRGLRLGADDWIAKPSHPEEVMARIEAVVRRRRRHEPRPRGRPGDRRRARDPRRPVPGLRRAAGASTSPAASSSSSTHSPRRRARCSSARTSTGASGATRWPTATAPSTSSSASCARRSRSTRPAGATSTPISGSGTASTPSTRSAGGTAPAGPPVTPGRGFRRAPDEPVAERRTGAFLSGKRLSSHHFHTSATPP